MCSMVDPAHGKLVTNVKGPYTVIGAIDTGAYYLKDQYGKEIPNPWNTSNLRKYYH